MERLRSEVREFAEEVVRPRVAEASDGVEHDLPRLLAKLGWIGLSVPRDWGGAGLGHAARAVVLQELARVSPAVATSALAGQLGAAWILRFGSREQRDRWLPAIADGSLLPAVAIADPAPDRTPLPPRAVRVGEDYLLDGRRERIVNRGVGDLYGVVLRTGRVPTAFFAEVERAGMDLPTPDRDGGASGFPVGPLRLRSVRIPASNRIGREGDGRDVASAVGLLDGRVGVAAVALGLHRAVLEAVDKWPDEVARVGANLRAAQDSLDEATHLLDAGAPYDADLDDAELVALALARDSVRGAVTALGTGHPLSRLSRDVDVLASLVTPAS